MTSKSNHSDQANKLRRQAEESVRGKTTPSTDNLEALLPEETLRRLHELQVYQVELEMQNEELRRTQAQLEAARMRYFELYDLAPVGYCTVNEEFLILEANLTASTLLGVTRGALVQKPISRFILKEDQDIYYLHRKQLLDTGDPQVCELQMVRADGTIFWAHLKSIAIRDTDGAPVCRIVLSDVTDRKQMEGQAARTEKLEAIGTLAAGVAHDFNNLLGAMFGYLELSKEEAERAHEKKIAEYLSKAITAFERAKSLTGQLLTFTKGGTPTRTTQSLSDLVRKAVTFSLSGSNITPIFDIPSGIWPGSVDENQISQVIDNMIINARQALPDGGEIEVSFDNIFARDIPESCPSRDYVKISICDHGPGIAPEYLPRIFDPFFSTKKMGSGLGLTTSYSIIRQHDGFIKVESQLGKGTTFHIYLPASLERIPVAVEEEKEQTRHRGTRNILIMDDEELVRNALELTLRNMGYSVVATRNRKETAEAVMDAISSGKPFSVAILDLTIPGGHGGEKVIEDLLKLDPDIKGIASSGYAENPIMSRPCDYGFAASLRKPYRKHDLSVVLKALFPHTA